MKKLLTIAAIVLALALAFDACGNPADETDGGTVRASSGYAVFNVITSPPGTITIGGSALVTSALSGPSSGGNYWLYNPQNAVVVDNGKIWYQIPFFNEVAKNAKSIKKGAQF